MRAISLILTDYYYNLPQKFYIAITMATKSTKMFNIHTSSMEGISGPEINVTPGYDTFQHLIGFGKYGTEAGELSYPQGIAIQEDTGQIFVSDWSNNRIQIFSKTGDFLNQFGNNDLINPCGILISDNTVYVTDYGHNALFLFTLEGLTVIKQVGREGSGFEEFHSPAQLALSPEQQFYVADSSNNRLQILNKDLDFKGSIEHSTMTSPMDIKFSKGQIFVLSRDDNPCVHVFSLNGDKIRSFISRNKENLVEMAFFFCLDSHGNIVISDYSAHDIKVFSPEGELLHTLGEHGHTPGTFYHPTGIAIYNQSKLVCVSDNFYTDIYIFSI